MKDAKDAEFEARLAETIRESLIAAEVYKGDKGFKPYAFVFGFIAASCSEGDYDDLSARMDALVEGVYS